jgi:hypothetical protein
MYKASMEEARCGAVSPGDSSKVAHDWRRSLTFHLKTCSPFTPFTTVFLACGDAITNVVYRYREVAYWKLFSKELYLSF